MDAPAQLPRPVLALDTATAQAGIAVGGDGRVTSLTWDAGRSHTTLLLGQVHRLLDLHGVAVGDLTAVAVAAGPGAFTGLRVGMSLAKGLALALGIPVLGIPTLEAAVLPFLDGRRVVVGVVPAGRHRFVWAPFAGPAERPQPLAPPANDDRAGLLAGLARFDAPTVVGDFGDDDGDAIAALPDASVPPRAVRLRQPGALLELALRRLAGGDLDDPVALEPVYLGR